MPQRFLTPAMRTMRIRREDARLVRDEVSRGLFWKDTGLEAKAVPTSACVKNELR